MKNPPICRDSVKKSEVSGKFYRRGACNPVEPASSRLKKSQGFNVTNTHNRPHGLQYIKTDYSPICFKINAFFMRNGRNLLSEVEGSLHTMV
jgi:hypothetical protein